MIDIDLLRNKPEIIREALSKRGESLDLDQVIKLDQERRSMIVEADDLRNKRNKGSKELSALKDKPQQLIDSMRSLGQDIKKLEDKIKDINNKINNIMLKIPNIPQDKVPLGIDDSENVILRQYGDILEPSFSIKPHWEIGEELGIIDFKRAVKISGTRFFVLKGQGAMLQRALISWMLDLHIKEHGYEEIYVPNIVNTETAIGSGQLPKFSNNMYFDEEDDFWLIPTAEVPLTSMHKNEILKEEDLPINYVAHSLCFRREKVAAGRDSRGIKRVHQFDKIEMYKLVQQENSDFELDLLLKHATEVCLRLGIPYRVIEICTGDLGFGSSRSYDIEMWAPGSEEWLEVSSCSNCTDFQSRRSSIKYRSARKKTSDFVHTLNGSGLALPRVIIAILENYQKEDGSIEIPEVLKPYTGFNQIS